MSNNDYGVNEISKALASVSEEASAFHTVNSPNDNYFTAKASRRVKDEYGKDDWNSYRPNQRVPTGTRQQINYGNDAYYKVGIVRNTIDLMSDFITKGMYWEHSNRQVEAFYNKWWEQCGGFEVTERFCSYLLRLGNVVIFPNQGKIPEQSAKEWRKTRGEEFQKINYREGFLPSSYVFINPTSLTHVSGELGSFANSRIFSLTLSTGLVGSVSDMTRNQKSMPTDLFRQMLKKIPVKLRNKILGSGGKLFFKEDELIIDHYRKDDWDDWARPMISGIFPQLIMLEKMHLADLSALDGAISNIRLWKVGYIDTNNIANSIIPTKAQLCKIRDLIHTNLSGGVLDLVWGPDLDFKESNTQVHKFLGPEKYVQVMRELYDGLGIPPALAGGGGGSSSVGSGFTNNFISMKVMIERLNYLRYKVLKFWRAEAKKVQKAMGFSSPAILSYDDAILSDENQAKKLMIDLWDRDIMDTESIQREFNANPHIVKSRLMKEYRRRKNHKVPPKASPYHNPMVVDNLEADLIKMGKISDDNMPFEIDETIAEPSEDFKPVNKNGRPPGVKDETKRKDKIVRPRTSAFIQLQNWARGAYDEISNSITPLYLNHKGKSSVRELNSTDCIKLENFKLAVLNTIKPFEEISNDKLTASFSNLPNSKLIRTAKSQILNEMEEKYNRKPTIEDSRIAACAAYSLLNIDNISPTNL